MSAYEDDADRFAEHIPEECDDPFCQICIEEEAQLEAQTHAMLGVLGEAAKR